MPNETATLGITRNKIFAGAARIQGNAGLPPQIIRSLPDAIPVRCSYQSVANQFFSPGMNKDGSECEGVMLRERRSEMCPGVLLRKVGLEQGVAIVMFIGCHPAEFPGVDPVALFA